MNKVSYNQIKKYHELGVFPKSASSKSNYRALANKYKINSAGILERNDKPVLLKADLNELWLQVHKAHSGRDATWNKINQRFYFKGGERWVRKKIRDCVACSHKKSSIWIGAKTPLRPIEVYPKAFWRINLDLLGPIYPVSEKGNKYILLMVDPLTKYTEACGNQYLSKDINSSFLRRVSILCFFYEGIYEIFQIQNKFKNPKKRF